ncbi:polysaccharide pyruvyl transferase family protein [soil metagenome]
MNDLSANSGESQAASIFVLGTPGFVRDPARFDIAATLKVVGLNTGNLVFQYAVAKLLTDPKVFIGLSELPYSAADTAKGGKYLVVPAANHLRLNADWTGFNNFLEASKVPLIVLGLGAQSPQVGGAQSTIDALKADPHTSRLAGILRDKAALVTVRGEFTADVCENLGLKNVEVLGCPSLMLNESPALGETLAKKIAAASLAKKVKSALSGAAPFEIRGGQKEKLERHLFRWVLEMGGYYYQQSGGEAAYALAAHDYSHVSLGAALSIKQILAPEIALGRFVKYFTSRARIRLDAEKWQNELAQLHISFGTRVHGNMIAIAGGTPGVLIAHDSRTGELAETMCLPVMSAEDAMASNTLQDALKTVTFDAAAFDRSRTEKAKAYCSAFDRLQLSFSPHLRGIANATSGQVQARRGVS